MSKAAARIRSFGPWFVWDRYPSYTLELVLTLCTSRCAREIMGLRLGFWRLRFVWHLERQWPGEAP